MNDDRSHTSAMNSGDIKNEESVKTYTSSTNNLLTNENSCNQSHFDTFLKGDMRVSGISKTTEMTLWSPFVVVNEYPNINSMIMHTNDVILLQEKCKEYQELLTNIDVKIDEYK